MWRCRTYAVGGKTSCCHHCEEDWERPSKCKDTSAMAAGTWLLGIASPLFLYLAKSGSNTRIKWSRSGLLDRLLPGPTQSQHSCLQDQSGSIEWSHSLGSMKYVLCYRHFLMAQRTLGVDSSNWGHSNLPLLCNLMKFASSEIVQSKGSGTNFWLFLETSAWFGASYLAWLDFRSQHCFKELLSSLNKMSIKLLRTFCIGW